LKFQRVICIVLDGCGAGHAPDAKDFGDFDKNEGDTLKHVWESSGGFDAPILSRMGFLKAGGIDCKEVEAVWGRLREVSIGKDTITGHWEMMGIHLKHPLPVYPRGFPLSLIEEFEKRIGKPTIGNVATSGTEIIHRLGKHHMETGFPIVYTSADSVFQIACHEEIVPLEELYRMCRIARDLLVEPHAVGRVIARPFIGSPETGFQRTGNRKDFPLPPPYNAIDLLSEKIGKVFGIGVIPEIFAGRGFRSVLRTQSNQEHYRMLMNALESDARFIWANFEDFDMLYGHRNDPQGFAKALEEFDRMLANILSWLREGDLLILTADHGNDPTTPSTDHTREYVPFSLWTLGMRKSKHLGDREGFWHVGATIADAFDVPFPFRANCSVLGELFAR